MVLALPQPAVHGLAVGTALDRVGDVDGAAVASSVHARVVQARVEAAARGAAGQRERLVRRAVAWKQLIIVAQNCGLIPESKKGAGPKWDG